MLYARNYSLSRREGSDANWRWDRKRVEGAMFYYSIICFLYIYKEMDLDPFEKIWSQIWSSLPPFDLHGSSYSKTKKLMV